VKRLALAWLAAAVLALAGTAAAAPPAVQAEAYLVVNAGTGEVLAASDADERLAVASITKLMTAIVALEHADPDDVVTVPRVAATVGESSIHLAPGERITVRDLLRAALIQSANDAALALAAHVGGGSVARFVDLMNEKAAALGLTGTHFANPHGLDAPGHYSTARDVTRLAQAAMRLPLVREIVRERGATIAGGRSLSTWNDLLGRFPHLLGVKTGHTADAGWSQVAAARGHGVTIYATVLGGPTRGQRNADLAELLAWGLSRYRAVTTIDAARVYARAATGYDRPAVPLVAARDRRAVVRVDRPVVERIVAPAVVALPVRQGQRLGEVRVYAGAKLIAREPLLAARGVSAPSTLDKVGWYAGRTADELWELVS
jgi:D-alanyl-D-alanine carboxypeptidase (penicillin-binding protein 5/6)